MQQPCASQSTDYQTDAKSCEVLLQGGSRTFFAASLVLPRRVRAPAIGLYAFCRLADDAIDQGADRAVALNELHARLDGIYAKTPCSHAADRAFAEVVQYHGIPKALPAALLEGFEWDALNRRYETLSELCAYGARVAGTVGAMMAMIMGARSRSLLARACDLGVAMQLTNIARDVGEDARNGRLYLPLEWMREAGLDPDEWLKKPVFSPQLRLVIARLLKTADELYRRADAGLSKLPPSCRPGMFAARLLYADIGLEVARRGYDSVSQRAVVPPRRKVRLLASSLLAAAFTRAECTEGPLPECLFLLDAMPHTADRECRRQRASRIESRVVWLAQLFERLERREYAL